MTLKNLPLQDRPRERLERLGHQALSTVELIAILLSSGTKNRTVLQLSADLLSHFGSLQSLSQASIPELSQVKGIGAAKAIQLKAAFALWWRLEKKKEEIFLDTPEKVYDLIRPDIALQKIEELWVILRDVRCRFLHREMVSRGTLTELLLHPREIFHTAIRHQAHTLILAHNHPSGDPTPSHRDLKMTRLLLNAGKIVGIEIIDHLIIGKSTFRSLYRDGFFEHTGY